MSATPASTQGNWLARSLGGIGDTFSVYRDTNYLWYWIASFSYYVGFFMDMFAVGYLAYEMTGSAVMLGAVVVSQGFPMAALSIIGGTLADRVSKRTLLVWSQLALALGAGLLLLLLATGLAEFWHVAVLSF